MELLIFTALISLCFGSFLNVLIVRIPQGKSISFPASHCVHCKKPLKFYHNIPLFSYIFLGGKCAFCKTKISPRYFVIELLTMCLAIFIHTFLGFNIGSALLFFSFYFLLALSAMDIETQMVPDSINFLALFFALLGIFFISDYFVFLEYFKASLMLAGGFTLLRFSLSSFLKKEVMGEGDIIVAATMGALMGIKLALLAVFLSALISLPFSLALKGKSLPFIPFLAFATLIVFCAREHFLALWQILYV